MGAKHRKCKLIDYTSKKSDQSNVSGKTHVQAILMLALTLSVLQGWLYLEPIFGSEDILQQMPNEGRKFRAVDATWRHIMAAVRKAPEVLLMCSDDELLKNLIEANKFLEQVLC